MGLNALLWRGWKPAFTDGAYSTVATSGLGGTDLQMLWHASHLTALGHRVQVLGASQSSFSERGVEFIGSPDRSAQVRCIDSGLIKSPELILLEGSYQAAPLFRERFPFAKIIHVGQNIDENGARSAFAVADSVDAFAFVGPGHLAQYSVRCPRLRAKFLLIRNAIPWREFHSRITGIDRSEKVVWVGSWGKRGLRQWCAVMAQIMRRRPNLTWVLCGPSYRNGLNPLPPHLLRALDIPANRLAVKSLGLPDLLSEIASARAVIVSLGNECGPVSILDAHAMARPVVSGNDVIYAYANPRGTGFRVASANQSIAALDFLLDWPQQGDLLGTAGREFALREFHEDLQREDLRIAIDSLMHSPETSALSLFPAPTELEIARFAMLERARNWWRRRPW